MRISDINSVFKNKYILILALLLIVMNGFSQIIIKGKIIDDTSSQPIPNVSIIIENTHIGTITNNDGVFAMHCGDTLLNGYVIISSLGYKKVIIKLKNLNDSIIRMDRVSTTLPEITIISNSNKRDLFSIVQHALLKIRQDNFSETKSKCYINITTFDNDIPVEIIEALAQTNFNNINGLTRLTLKTGKIAYSLKNNYKFFNFEFVKTLTSFSIFRKNNINNISTPESVCNLNDRKSRKYFSYKSDTTMHYDKEDVIKINCKNTLKNKPYLNTSIYVGIKSGDVYSLTNYGYVYYNKLFYPMDNDHHIDSLFIKISYLFKNYPEDSSYLHQIRFDYTLNYIDSINSRKINSKYFVYLFGINKSFFIPKITFTDNDNDYVKLLTLHYDSTFWNKNISMVESKTEKELKRDISTKGMFINYNNDNFSVILKTTTINSFLPWSRNNKLTWNDIYKEDRNEPITLPEDASTKKRLFDEDLYNLDFQIYFDMYQIPDTTLFFSKTLFSKDNSFYYLERDSTALNFINLYFDLYEDTRKSIMGKLNLLKNISSYSVDSLYNSEIDLLNYRVKKFKEETKRGTDREKMEKWKNEVMK